MGRTGVRVVVVAWTFAVLASVALVPEGPLGPVPAEAQEGVVSRNSIPLPSPSPARVGAPGQVTVLGDSISSAVGATGDLKEGYNAAIANYDFGEAQLPYSWATGDISGSVWNRMKAFNPGIGRRNLAVTGREMEDFVNDANQLGLGDDFVMVLYGGNNVCEPSEAEMVSFDRFRSELVNGLNRVREKNPNALIYMPTVPDIWMVWYLRGSNTYYNVIQSPYAEDVPIFGFGGFGLYDAGARNFWQGLNIAGIEIFNFPCQTMLAAPNSTDLADELRRDRVREYNIAINRIIVEECNKILRCRHDNWGLFNRTSNRENPPNGRVLDVGFWTFLDSDISYQDHFHPRAEGQDKIGGWAMEDMFDWNDRVAPWTWVDLSWPEAPGEVVATVGAGDDISVRGIEWRVHRPWGIANDWQTTYGSSVNVGMGSDDGVIEARAVDVNGNVSASQFTPVYRRPPTVDAGQIQVTRGDGAVEVRWPTVTGVSGNAVTGYQVRSEPDLRTCSTGTGGDTQSCTVSGLNNGTEYRFRVTAIGEQTSAAISAPSVAVTPAVEPDAPTELTTEVTPAGLVVSWTAPDDGGSPITSYVVEADPGGATCTTAPPSTECAFTELYIGTNYSFTVTATNDVGSSPTAGPTDEVRYEEAPSVPTNLTTVTANTRVTVSWDPPDADGGAPVTSYDVSSRRLGWPFATGSCTATAPATSCVVDGLVNGTSHTFTVTATNRVGAGPAASTSATPAPWLADPPTDVVVTAEETDGDSAIVVSWTTPDDDGGLPITGYTATASPGGWTCSTSSTPPALPATTCTIDDAPNGASYTVRVVATNADGDSVDSDPSPEVTLAAGRPTAPASVDAAKGNTQVTVSWSPPDADGGLPLTGYTATALVASSGTPAGSCTTDAEGTTCAIDGLTNGTAYDVTVVATNNAGDGPATAAAGTVIPRTTPSAPTSVIGSPGMGRITVSWSAPTSTGGATVVGYVARASVTATGAAAGSCTTDAEGTTCAIDGLTNGTGYTVAVVASNSEGEGAAASVTATPRTVPGSPRMITATARHEGADVSWLPPTSDGGAAVTGYVVSATHGVTGSVTTTCVPTGETTCRFSDLVNGVSYSFTVRATNAAGTGVALGAASATPAPQPPDPPSTMAASPSNGAISIAWDPPIANGSPIVSYLVTATPRGWPFPTATCETTVLTSCDLTGLRNFTNYTIKIIATNGIGTGTAATMVAAPVARVPDPPLAVTATMVDGGGNGAVRVRWSMPEADYGTPVSEYLVTVSPSGATCRVTAADGEPPARLCDFTGLEAGTSHAFTVAAINGNGRGPNSAASPSLNLPDTWPTIAPTGLPLPDEVPDPDETLRRPPPEPIARFADIPEGAYYDEAVQWAQRNDVTTGVDGGERFAPGRPVTRAEVLTFLWRAAGRPAAAADCGVVDVAPTSFAAAAVCWALDEGVTTGWGGDPTRVRPDIPATRGHVAAFLWRAAGRPEPTAPCSLVDVGPPGRARIGSGTPACWLAEHAITVANPFRPERPMTRAQLVTMLHRWDSQGPEVAALLR